MKSMDDIQLLTIIKTSTNEADVTQAKEVLWERYVPFVGQKFFQWRESMVRANITKEDFMAEAYIRFCYAIDKFDLNGKAKQLSTFLFYALYKIKNDADTEWIKRGWKTTYFSDYDKPTNDTSYEDYDNDLAKAISVDFESQYQKHIANKTIMEYRDNESDEEKIFILDSMLDGVSTAEIIRTLSINRRKCDARRMINGVKDNLKKLALKNGFCCV